MKKNVLSAHLKNVHGASGNIPVLAVSAGSVVLKEVSPAVEKQQYACGICDKVFKQPHHLKQHLLSSHVSIKMHCWYPKQIDLWFT